jgi:monofunctional biosynthetic peptidoglycan transglycosylase
LLLDGSVSESRWIAVNDGVMGGRPQGGPALVDGNLQFLGEVSLANDGGISSVRTIGQAFDFAPPRRRRPSLTRVVT